MNRPEKVALTCPHCGHTWLEPTSSLLKAEVVIYRDAGETSTVKRRLRCPNCHRWLLVDVPEGWLSDE